MKRLSNYEFGFYRTSSTAPPTTSKPPPNDGICRQEGFIGDSEDCHKFYRCVDNGKGGFTRYDFVCGEGTAWNSDITACDYEENVKTCKGSSGTTTTSTAHPPCNTTTTEGTTTEGTTTEGKTTEGTTTEGTTTGKFQFPI